MRLIGLNGGMGVGKSTAISALEKAHSSGPVKLIKFAGPLYEFQEFMYNRIRPVYQRPASFVKDRKLLQWLGTEWGRGTISENVWVDLWRADVQAALADPNTVVVCDDVRFDNEAALLKSMGGVLIAITSNTAFDRMKAAGLTGIPNHASEAGVNPSYLDYVLENNGSLETYQDSLSRLFALIGVGERDKAEHVPA